MRFSGWLTLVGSVCAAVTTAVMSTLVSTPLAAVIGISTAVSVMLILGLVRGPDGRR